jgi:hypothetical protein
MAVANVPRHDTGNPERPMRVDKAAIATPELVRLQAGATIVEFIWATDRWQHEIRTADARGWFSIEGVDGGADPRWPQSPVLTEFSLEQVAGKPVLLGVGLAGRSHFSMCVTVHPDDHEKLLFEAACRIHTVAEWLGSSYRCEDGRVARIEPEPPIPAPPATVCWNYTAGPGGLQAVPPAVARAAGG